MQTILLIEDDSQTRKLLKRMLNSAGYNVHEAADGREGVRLFEQNPADLVITDLVMPEQEGIETIRLLKQIVADVKIIAISGGGRIGPENYLSMAERLGAQRSLKKPIKREDLLTAVKEVLQED
jgi:CheY-like chemotaxis protein